VRGGAPYLSGVGDGITRLEFGDYGGWRDLRTGICGVFAEVSV